MYWGIATPGQQPRYAGIIVPGMAARPENPHHDFGCGDYRAYRDVVRAASELGVKVVRDLPDSDSGTVDFSPFMGLVPRALNPLRATISADEVPGLTDADVRAVDPTLLNGLRRGQINYEAVLQVKRGLLWKSFLRFQDEYISTGHELANEFHTFSSNRPWLGPYSLFRSLLDWQGSADWSNWDAGVRTFSLAQNWLEGQQDRETLRTTCQFWRYVQWVLYRQRAALKAYATERDVLLIGMLSYATVADPWVEPSRYLLGWWGGAPPEPAFTGSRRTQLLGQVWGATPPDLTAQRRDGYASLKEQGSGLMEVCHGGLLDHGIGWARGPFCFPFPESEADQYVGLSREEVMRRVEARTGQNLYPRYFPREGDEGEDARLNYEEGMERLLAIRDAMVAAGGQLTIVEDLGKKPRWMDRLLEELRLARIIVTKYWRKHDFGPYEDVEKLPYLAEVNPGTHDFPPQCVQYAMLFAAAQVGDRDAKQELDRYLHFIGMGGQSPPTSYTPDVRRSVLWTHLRSPCGLATFGFGEIDGSDFMTHVVGQVDPFSWRRRAPRPLTARLDEPAFREFAEMIRKSGRSPKGAA
jgi:4-alpha-glucanotransferase